MFSVVTIRHQALMNLLRTEKEEIEIPEYTLDLAVRDLKTATDLMHKAVGGR
jgi:hypothetical protein